MCMYIKNKLDESKKKLRSFPREREKDCMSVYVYMCNMCSM